jgi:hypothetical protein
MSFSHQHKPRDHFALSLIDDGAVVGDFVHGPGPTAIRQPLLVRAIHEVALDALALELDEQRVHAHRHVGPDQKVHCRQEQQLEVGAFRGVHRMTHVVVLRLVWHRLLLGLLRVRMVVRIVRRRVLKGKEHAAEENRDGHRRVEHEEGLENLVVALGVREKESGEIAMRQNSRESAAFGIKVIVCLLCVWWVGVGVGMTLCDFFYC